MSDESAKSVLELFCDVLDIHGVEHIVIGGQAEWIFGSPRVTYDVDLCYRRSNDNLDRLARALRELSVTLRGAPEDLPFRIDADSLARCSKITINTTGGPLDLLGWVEPLGDYDKLLENAELYQIGSHDVKVIALDDLIKVKQHLARSRDCDSLLQLLAIKRVRQEGNGGTDDIS